MAFLTSDKFGGPWAKAGGWLSPHKTFDVSNYPNETTRKIADIANNAGRAALRRLGPHAQGRRLGHLLDRDGQVGERAELAADR